MVFDCSNRNYAFTEALMAACDGKIALEDIQETITKKNVTCESKQYDVQCVYCAIEVQLGLKWE